MQPANKPETVTLSLNEPGTFGGTLADNGAGVLALDYRGTTIQGLTGVNTYSGPTTIESGGLKLTGNGSATSTSMSIGPAATLELDDSGAVIGNRLSPTAPISINGGTISVNPNTTMPVNENAGPLQFAGAARLNVPQLLGSNPPVVLSFAGLTRVGHAVLSIGGPEVSIAGLTNGSTGVVGPYMTILGDWATVGVDGHITAFTAYVPDINTASATDNVRIVSSATTTLAAPSTIGSLNLQSAGTVNPVLDLGGHELGLTTGGIICSTGTGTTVIQNGSLSTPSGEFVINAFIGLTINADIVDYGSGTALTMAADIGPVTLTGNNTYTGPTSIMQGTLVVSSDANLGLGTMINFGNAWQAQGVLKAAGSFVSAKGIATDSGGGTINTNGFNVEFSGPVSGILTKTGAGTLTLDNSMLSNLTATQGFLVLPHGSSGGVTAPNLQAAGSLSFLSWTGQSSTTSTLDIGGPAAATLTIGNFAANRAATYQVDFGLGAKSSDLLATTRLASFPSQPGDFQFEFQNLGGLTTGVAYPLISFPSSPAFTPPSSSVFAIAPDLIAAGWAGTFTSTASGLSVTFTSVPEPSAIWLLALGIVAVVWRRGVIDAPRRIFLKWIGPDGRLC